jgi:hypothetical protein
VEPTVKFFCVPKRGNGPEECDDAGAHSAHRFAVADGATESSFADRWAQTLVKHFISNAPDHIRNNNVPLEEWLRPLQKEWHASIPWDRLPWYAEEKARGGAFCSLVAVEITPAPSRFRIVDLFRRRKGIRWHAMSVGDSFFAHIRKDTMLKAFPFEKSDQFNSRPLLISSNPNRNQPVWKNIQQAEGDVEDGDLLVLMTDALGAWFLKQHESGKKPWAELLTLNTIEEFGCLVEQLRSSSALKNDDTTLLICHWKDR